jgi:hypothetical protein
MAFAPEKIKDWFSIDVPVAASRYQARRRMKPFRPTRGCIRGLRGDLSSGIPPPIEKDRPLDRLRFNENAAFCPRISSKQVRRLRCIASLHDEENSTAVRVRATEDDPALLEEAIHEMRMLLPERLLTAR